MSRPAIIKIHGGNTYIESDLQITNAKPSVFTNCGGNPVMFNKMSGTIVLDSELFYFSPHARGYNLNLINQNFPDVCCGSDRIGSEPGVNQIPKLKQRGAVNSFGGFKKLVVGNTDFSNPSKEEIINYFKAFLADTGDAGKKLYYYDTKGKKTQFVTMDDVYREYQEYFFHEYQTNKEATSSIAGKNNSRGYFSENSNKSSDEFGGLYKMFKSRGLSDAAVRQELISMGYTTAQINEALNPVSTNTAQPKTSSSSSGTGGSGYGSGGASAANNPGTADAGLGGSGFDPVTTITLQRSRNIFGDAIEVGNSFVIKNNQEKNKYLLSPQIFQIVPSINKQYGYVEYVPNRYIFTHRPNEISYSGLGNEWVTVDRTGGFAFVDWKKFQLLQISFNFVIAKPLDGLLEHVEDEIQMLRKIAQTPYPVSFFNFDSMFTQEFRYDTPDSGRFNNEPIGIQFVINDFSIVANQRDSAMRITRAQATMSLQEIPIEKQKLIPLPRLMSKNPKIPPPPPPGAPVGFNLGSSVLDTGFMTEPWSPPEPKGT